MKCLKHTQLLLHNKLLEDYRCVLIHRALGPTQRMHFRPDDITSGATRRHVVPKFSRSLCRRGRNQCANCVPRIWKTRAIELCRKSCHVAEKKKRKMWPLEDTPCEFGHNPYPCTNAARHAGNVFLSIVNVVDTQVALLLPTGNMECRHTELFM